MAFDPANIPNELWDKIGDSLGELNPKYDMVPSLRLVCRHLSGIFAPRVLQHVKFMSSQRVVARELGDLIRQVKRDEHDTGFRGYFQPLWSIRDLTIAFDEQSLYVSGFTTYLVHGSKRKWDVPDLASYIFGAVGALKGLSYLSLDMGSITMHQEYNFRKHAIRSYALDRLRVLRINYTYRRSHNVGGKADFYQHVLMLGIAPNLHGLHLCADIPRSLSRAICRKLSGLTSLILELDDFYLPNALARNDSDNYIRVLDVYCPNLEYLALYTMDPVECSRYRRHTTIMVEVSLALTFFGILKDEPIKAIGEYALGFKALRHLAFRICATHRISEASQKQQLETLSNMVQDLESICFISEGPQFCQLKKRYPKAGGAASSSFKMVDLSTLEPSFWPIGLRNLPREPMAQRPPDFSEIPSSLVDT